MTKRSLELHTPEVRRITLPRTPVNKDPLVGGSAEQLSATVAQRAQHRREHGIDLGQVRPYVIRFFYRDELRVENLIRRLLRSSHHLIPIVLPSL